jgi:hypothetical protein
LRRRLLRNQADDGLSFESPAAPPTNDFHGYSDGARTGPSGAPHSFSIAIADEFGVSVRTIENRRAAICEKLWLSGVNSLLKYALDHKSDLH